MTDSRLRHLLLALAATAALAGCGSSGSDEDTTTPVAKTTDVPQSAQDSVGGLFAFLTDLIANGTNSTSEPLLVGTATLPTTETSEPNN